jgi:sporulation protein YlmC with PRC-barrel domain
MSTTLRLADLIGSKVITADGKKRGHVVDVVVTADAPHRLLALEVGVAAWLDRLNMTRLTKRHRFPSSRQRIPWEHVDRVEKYTIHLKPDADAQ